MRRPARPALRPVLPVLLAALLASGLDLGLGAAPVARSEDAIPSAPPGGGPASRPAPPPTPPTSPDVPPAPAEPDWVLLGELPLAPDPVIDGDTLRLAPPAPAKSVRVQSVDAEEVFHAGMERDRAAALADFPSYARGKRGASAMPVKFGTPLGEEARAFVRRLLAGVTRVRLERDEDGRDLDGHGRLLAHVLFERDGRRVLLAEELLRAGLSPYFVKYGRSKRYDARLRAAVEEARAAGRGIFDPAAAHYPDYDERLAWWESRARQVDAWDADVLAPPGRSDHVRLGVPKETSTLRARLGTRVTVFGTLDHVRGDGTPRILYLVDKPREAFPVVVFDETVWAGLDLAAISRRFVRVTGVLSEYRGRPQIKLASAEELSTR